MKNKNIFVSLLVYAVGFVAIWNVLDFLYSAFITKTPYQFSITTDMLTPLGITLLIEGVELNKKK